MTTDAVVLLLRLGIVVALYAFLVALWLAIRRDMHAVVELDQPGAVGATADEIAVVDAGSGSLAPGTRFPLAETTALGRAADNQVVLDDQFVSSHHASLSLRDGAWWLRDLGSTNGTLLNGRQIGGPTRVGPEDVVGVGGARLRLVRADGRAWD
jgi:pSer/pThr/pTyr-binding forkhead associated (FHA) protein